MPALKFGIVAGAFLKKLVPRGGVPWASNISALHWQTPTRGSFDPQRLSGALANPTRAAEFCRRCLTGSTARRASACNQEEQ